MTISQSVVSRRLERSDGAISGGESIQTILARLQIFARERRFHGGLSATSPRRHLVAPLYAVFDANPVAGFSRILQQHQ